MRRHQQQRAQRERGLDCNQPQPPMQPTHTHTHFNLYPIPPHNDINNRHPAVCSSIDASPHRLARRSTHAPATTTGRSISTLSLLLQYPMTTTTTTTTTSSSSSSRMTAAAATPRRRRRMVARAAAAAVAAVLVLAPSSALAFVVSVPAPATTTPLPRWQGAATVAAVAGTPFATARRAFTPVPSRVTAAAAAAADDEEEEEEDDEDDDKEEEEGPRPPRPFTPPPVPISYESEALPSKTIDGAWNALRKPLLRLGTKGVQKSHRNSLKELLAAHRAVRVKVNGPAHDVKPTAERLAAPDPGETDPLAVLLRVKGKEFLLATPAEVAALKKGKAPGAVPE